MIGFLALAEAVIDELTISGVCHVFLKLLRLLTEVLMTSCESQQ